MISPERFSLAILAEIDDATDRLLDEFDIACRGATLTNSACHDWPS